MTETTKGVAITFRCPSELNNSIEQQTKQTKQSKTDIILDLLLGSLPNVKITERAKLPPKPAIYLVYTPDHQLLYIGKADNLQKRWNSHHKYQYFIESSINCRIGYFPLDSIKALNSIAEEFQQESDATQDEVNIATTGQINELRQELYALKRQYDITFNSLSQLGLENLISRLETLKPPKGRQTWEATAEDQQQGITRSALLKHFGFNSINDLETAAAFHNLDSERYLEELSGWHYRGEAGSPRGRFHPPSSTSRE